MPPPCTGLPLLLLLALPLVAALAAAAPGPSLACPKSMLNLRFDAGVCPSRQEPALLACPLQSAFTCCGANHDRVLRGASAACLVSGASPACCAAFSALACVACDGGAALQLTAAGAAGAPRVCAGACTRLLRSCARAFFAADEAGRLAVCDEHSLVCSRLSDIVNGSSAGQRDGADAGSDAEGALAAAQDQAAVCERLGFAVALDEPGRAGTCFSGAERAVKPVDYVFDNVTCRPRERRGEAVEAAAAAETAAAAAAESARIKKGVSVFVGFICVLGGTLILFSQCCAQRQRQQEDERARVEQRQDDDAFFSESFGGGPLSDDELRRRRLARFAPPPSKPALPASSAESGLPDAKYSALTAASDGDREASVGAAAAQGGGGGGDGGEPLSDDED